MTEKNRRWINFGRYSSPPIGRGKILSAGFSMTDIPMLHLKVEVNGIVYEGTLPANLSEGEEE